RDSRQSGGWWVGIHWIAAIGLLARFVVAFVSLQINHPDELFQYLEQGHRLAFGYGYIPWEYRFGVRSWILPGFISVLLGICKALHLTDPNTYDLFIKVSFCLISVSVVYFAYIIGRRLASETAGRLSATFVACWYELIYFGHKAVPEALS